MQTSALFTLFLQRKRIKGKVSLRWKIRSQLHFYQLTECRFLPVLQRFYAVFSRKVGWWLKKRCFFVFQQSADNKENSFSRLFCHFAKVQYSPCESSIVTRWKFNSQHPKIKLLQGEYWIVITQGLHVGWNFIKEQGENGILYACLFKTLVFYFLKHLFSFVKYAALKPSLFKLKCGLFLTIIFSCGV